MRTISVGGVLGIAASSASDEPRARSDTSCEAIAEEREARKVREAKAIGSGRLETEKVGSST